LEHLSRSRFTPGSQQRSRKQTCSRDYAKKRGYHIYSVYEDIVSGAAREREALDHRKFDIVLVWKFDRFARSLKMLVDSLALFQDLGIDFISYKENIDTTTSMGRLIFHINSAYAEFEREIIRDLVIAEIKAKRQKTGSWGRRRLHMTVQEKIHELSKKGLSIRKIAKNLQISARTVQKYLKSEVNAMV
jgi:DNA invertase Pin-like site-specific DNA recombinase